MRCLTFLFCLLSLSTVHSYQDKLYVDLRSIDIREDRCHIHTGHNIWIETSTVRRDEKGLFTLKSDIKMGSWENRMEYEKKWKCPYCHAHYPWGTPCRNEECPSRFSDMCS